MHKHSYLEAIESPVAKRSCGDFGELCKACYQEAAIRKGCLNCRKPDDKLPAHLQIHESVRKSNYDPLFYKT
jgi:hypothetical protein